MLTAEIRVQKSSDKENTDKWCTCSSRCKIYVMTPDLNNLITTFNPNKKKRKNNNLDGWCIFKSFKCEKLGQ